MLEAMGENLSNLGLLRGQSYPSGAAEPDEAIHVTPTDPRSARSSDTAADSGATTRTSEEAGIETTHTELMSSYFAELEKLHSAMK